MGYCAADRGVQADGDLVEEAVCRRGDRRAGGPAQAGQAADHDDVAIVLATLEPPLKRLGVTHWSSRLLAADWASPTSRSRSVRNGDAAVAHAELQVLHRPGLWRPRSGTSPACTSTPRTRPWCCAWTRNPRRRRWNARRRAPPLRPGVPEKRSHDYIRHGTTALFAALEAATGKVTGACYPQHRHEEFLAFLKQVARAYPRVPLHIVCDNYGTHTHPDVRAWLDRHPRITLAFHADVGVVAESR